MASGSALRLLLKHARETVDECLPSNVSRENLNNDTLDGKLNEVLFAVSSAGHGSSKSIDLSWEDKADIWHVVCKLWVGTAHRHVCPSLKIPKNRNVPKSEADFSGAAEANQNEELYLGLQRLWLFIRC